MIHTRYILGYALAFRVATVFFGDLHDLDHIFRVGRFLPVLPTRPAVPAFTHAYN